MSRRDYQTGGQQDTGDLLGDILGDTTSNSFDFDPSSYFDDWFDDPGTSSGFQSAPDPGTSSGFQSAPDPGTSSGFQSAPDPPPPQHNANFPEFESVSSLDAQPLEPPQPFPSAPQDREYHASQATSSRPPPIALERLPDSKQGQPQPGETYNPAVPYGDESLGFREPPPPSFPTSTFQGEEEEDELSYDHYEFAQAGVKPFTAPTKLYHDSQDDLDSGIIMDSTEHSLLLGKCQGDSDSRQSFDITMSEEETAKKARWCLICLKTYCVIFIITMVTLGVYVASDFTTDAQVTRKTTDDENLKTGYKELRLGGRRVYYRTAEPEEMANHTALLIHGEKQNGEIFHKLGSMDFLKDHGVRVVAIDVIGYGKSDPPIHLPDSYETFFTEVVSLFELEYNLIIVCVELGCEKILPYYLNHGVYRTNNRFIEGAVLISPKGTTYDKYIQEDHQYKPTATRTVVVNGGKDSFINMDVNRLLSMVPRCEIHALPNLKNNFYTNKHTKSYFHAALEAFVENLEYDYDKDLERKIDGDAQQPQTNLQQNSQNYGQNFNQQYINGGNNQQQPYYDNQRQQGQQGDMFSKFKAQQSNTDSKFKDIGYNPAHRFSGITGKRKK